MAWIALQGLLSAPALLALESIDVTASRLTENRPLMPVTRIGRAAIDLMQPASVVDLLRMVPGVDITQAGGRGGIPFVSVRGGEPNFTLVLLDGVPVNDPTNSRGGGFDFNLVDPDTIERIEVFRGGTSAVHGGDALNGVIHIHTRGAPSRPGGAVRVNGGSPRSTGGSFFAGGGDGHLSGSVTAAAATRENGVSGVEADTAQAMAGAAFHGERLDVRARLLHARSDTAYFPEDSGGKRLARLRERTRSESAQWLVSLGADFRARDGLAVRGSASWSRHRAEEDNPGIAPGMLDGVPPNRIESTYERARVNGLAEWQAAGWLDFVAGFAYDHERGRNDGVIDIGFSLPVAFTLVRDTASVFTEAQARWEGVLGLSVGVRHDDPEGFDAETTSRAMLSIESFGPVWRPYVTWSESFKLPSLFALGNPLVGNADLLPERARSVEVGFAAAPRSTDGNLRIALFRTRYRDLVDFDPARFINVNRDRVVIHGAEVEMHWQPVERLGFMAGYTYTRYDVEPGGGRLRRRPRHKGVVGIDLAFGARWRTTVNLAVIGASLDASIATGQVPLPGYELLNLAATCNLERGWELGLGLRNLLDQHFEETIGVPDAGLSFRAEVRYSF